MLNVTLRKNSVSPNLARRIAAVKRCPRLPASAPPRETGKKTGSGNDFRKTGSGNDFRFSAPAPTSLGPDPLSAMDYRYDTYGRLKRVTDPGLGERWPAKRSQ